MSGSVGGSVGASVGGSMVGSVGGSVGSLIEGSAKKYNMHKIIFLSYQSII